MAYDYAFVHLKYTIPLAGLLTFILRPILTRPDLYKTFGLIVIAFVATLPWDSYLIRHGVWTYPPDVIIGPRLAGIPIEELFFFVIQTYITSMVYILFSKPVLHAQFLTNKSDSSPKVQRMRTVGQTLLASSVLLGAWLVQRGGEGTYLGLILVWACPFALLTWSCSGYFLLKLPLHCVITPILLPTLYLWIVDELALGRGTWSIETGTKLGYRLWGSLELEEATFFLATNALIVFGLTAFDRGMAVFHTFPEIFPKARDTPFLTLVLKAIFTNPSRYDISRVRGIREAVVTLQRKSRSFFLASSVFPGRLRVDLILLVADDLVDESHSEREALEWINKLAGYLRLVYPESGERPDVHKAAEDYVEQNFPKSARSALELLPTSLLPKEPLYDLLEGFKLDLTFSHIGSKADSSRFPIADEKDLELYAERVASTVGELCVWLAFHHSRSKLSSHQETILVHSARTMGHALQYVNIGRDIAVDAEMGRVYLPTNWLKEEGLTPLDVIRDPTQPKAEKLRQRLLDLAFKEYAHSRPTMSILPSELRGPLIVAVESYMEIGRVLQEKSSVPSKTRKGRATVPRSRRMWVAWKSLSAQ